MYLKITIQKDLLFSPQCSSKQLTGYYCSGCGSQRAVHSL
ncbi:DUF2752 domain-containing protein [Nonlabens sp.]